MAKFLPLQLKSKQRIVRPSFFFLLYILATTSFAQVTNVFSPVTAFTLGTQSCNGTGTATSITISTNNAAFGVGNTVLIIQMKGATVNTASQPEPPTAAADAVFGSITSLNAAGNYEFAVVATNSGGSPATLTFTQPLVNTYTPTTDPVQLVSVPQFANLTISSPLTGTKWNGTTGGVMVFDVGGTLTLNSTINMDSMGFRGGKIITLSGATACNSGPYTLATTPTATTAQNSAGRGEGIVTNAAPWGRGAMANGGGGGSGHNGGGAGGGNYCAGGIGGYEYSACYSYTGPTFPFYPTTPSYVAGFGGGLTDRQALPGYAITPGTTKVFMGGGGGAGNGDDGDETPGGNGGGIIIISAGQITGTSGTISAEGQAGWRNGLAPYTGTSDGVGGGGAGGSILLNVSTYTISSLTVQANGGKGGDNYQASTCHGSGGGGGAGYIALSIATPSNVTTSAVGGVNGETRPDANSSTDENCYKSNYGAASGSSCAGTVGNTLSLNTMNCPCSVANLGPDQSLCGSVSITLKNGTASNTVAGGANKVFTWYLNGTVIAGATGPTYTLTLPGVYEVQVDSLGCIKTSTVTITNTLPVPYLGPNESICSPSFYNLSTPNASSFPATTKFQWYLNGTALAGDTNVSLPDVTAPGTYKLVASITGCASTSDTVTLTSTALVAVNGCRSSTGTVTLSVSNTLSGGPYNWYSAATGGTVLAGGSNTTTFTTPSISTTTTYYVEDDGLYTTTPGPPPIAGTPGQAGNTAPLLTLYFNALKAFKLNGLTVIVATNSCACTNNFNIQFDVKNSSGTLVGSGIATVNCCPTGVTAGTSTYTITFTSPISIPVGNNYTINVNSSTGNTVELYTGSVTTYPETYSPVFSITGNGDNNNPNGAPAYYNWNVSYAQGCARVPVVATISPSCPTATPVKLIEFTAELANGKVELNWSTASELNNNYFLVQRSTDGDNFTTIDTVKGHGNSNTILYYQYTDNAPVTGTVYYRLVQVDYNGTQNSSSLASVTNEQSLTATVYPNPFDKTINLLVSSREIYKVKVQITDLSGKVLYSSDQYTTNQTILLGQELTSGMYVLEIVSPTAVKTFKIVKE